METVRGARPKNLNTGERSKSKYRLKAFAALAIQDIIKQVWMAIKSTSFRQFLRFSPHN